MIEGPGGAPSHRGPTRRFPFERLMERLRASFGALRQLVTVSGSMQERSDPLLWRLQMAGRILWLVLAGLGLYLVIDVILVPVKPPSFAVRPAAGNPESSSKGVASTDDHLRSLADYRQTLAIRNPFGLSAHRDVPTGAGGGKSRLGELVSTLAIVGINRGRVPEALIEDTAAQRTYFVKVGDQVNGVTVKAIDQNGVRVAYEGEETVLK